MAEEPKKVSDEELYQCLKSLNVPVRLSDIKTPTKEFVIRVFECCLKDLQIDINHPSLRPFHAIKHLENPEMYEECHTLMLFVHMISCIFGISIFVRDIIHPKPKRTKRILYSLIVIWNYVLRKCASFLDLVESLRGEQREAEALDLDNKRMNEKYNECLLMLKNEFPSKEELISLNASKEEKSRELAKLKEAMTEEYNAVKKRENNFQTKITDTEVNIVSTKEKIDELDQLILTSPEKISTDIQKMKELIRNEETKIKEKEIELKEKKKNLEGLVLVQQNNEKDTEILRDIESGLEKLNEIVRNLVINSQKCQEEAENLKNLQLELERKEELKSMYEKKSAKVLLNFQKQKEALIENLQMLQQNVNQELNNLSSLKAANLEFEQKIDDVVTDIVETVNACKEAEKLTLKEKADYESQMEAIAATFASDCKEIKQQISESFSL